VEETEAVELLVLAELTQLLLEPQILVLVEQQV